MRQLPRNSRADLAQVYACVCWDPAPMSQNERGILQVPGASIAAFAFIAPCLVQCARRLRTALPSSMTHHVSRGPLRIGGLCRVARADDYDTIFVNTAATYVVCVCCAVARLPSRSRGAGASERVQPRANRSILILARAIFKGPRMHIVGPGGGGRPVGVFVCWASLRQVAFVGIPADNHPL